MVVFFFKQKTAYEMRISDWSSDVCSSDLELKFTLQIDVLRALANDSSTPQDMIEAVELIIASVATSEITHLLQSEAQFSKFDHLAQMKIGRASCRERVCQYV